MGRHDWAATRVHQCCRSITILNVQSIHFAAPFEHTIAHGTCTRGSPVSFWVWDLISCICCRCHTCRTHLPTHAHATHASRHFPDHHACIPIYILASSVPCTVVSGHNSTRAISFTHAHATHICIDHILISSHNSLFGRAGRLHIYNFHSGACAFS